MRWAIWIGVAIWVGMTSGCSTGSGTPTSPRAAIVRFDSLTRVVIAGRPWQAFALRNVGSATAYWVVAYWHVTGQDSARTSSCEPSGLAVGETGLATTMPLGDIAWLVPSGPDSIHWVSRP